MSFLSHSLNSAVRRQLLRPASLNQVRFATQGYGNGKGDPKASDPQSQGANPSADKEHPGPAPPKAGKGSGSATKGTSDGHNTDGAKQKSSKRSFSTIASTRTFSTTARSLSEDRPKTVKGLRPAILDESPPKEEDQSEDVKKHNEDLSKRFDRPFAGTAHKDEFKKENAPEDEATEKEKTG
jgi:hypothetical protein